MKFGHYSNEELGIKRNLTCAMFDSKGAGIVPPKPEAGDVKCGENELDEAEMDNDIDEDMDNDLDESMSEDDDELALDNDIDEAEMSEDDEEIQAGLEDEAECELDDETEMSEDELDAACGLEDEDMSEDDDELQAGLEDEAENSGGDLKCWNTVDDELKRAMVECIQFCNQCGLTTGVKKAHLDWCKKKMAAAKKAAEERLRNELSGPALSYQLRRIKSRYEKVKKDLPAIANSVNRLMSNDIDHDQPEDVKCSRRCGRGRNMSNEIDKAKNVECAKKDWNKSFYTGEMHTALNSYTREHAFDGLSTDQRAKKLVEVFDKRLKATVKNMVADAKYDGADKDRVQYIQQLCEGIARENRNKWLKEFMSNYGLRPKKK